jgi:hypothetical protein
MKLQASVVHSELSGRHIKPIVGFDAKDFEDLSRLGVFLSKRKVAQMVHARQEFAMDSLQPLQTAPSISTPVQFLQEWLPGFVEIITGARKIDTLIGIQTVGSWEDEQIVQGVKELTAAAQPYGDYTNIPEASWNTNWVYRTVVRFEQGLMCSVLEEARAGRINVDSSGAKRNSCMLSLEIQRNAIGFNGFNAGDNNTYGFLNDPNLSNYHTVAENAASSSTEWANKSFLEICNDIRTAIAGLRQGSQDQIDPEELPLTLALATAVVDYLSTVSDFGISVREWMRQAYPTIRVVSAPELTGANSDANVGYLYADRINDASTDGGSTWIQAVPAKFLALGVERLAKGFKEDYSNATAGAMCKRPWGVYRMTGI